MNDLCSIKLRKHTTLLLPKQCGYFILVVFFFIIFMLHHGMQLHATFQNFGHEHFALPKQKSQRSHQQAPTSQGTGPNMKNMTLDSVPRNDAVHCSCENDLNSMYCCQRALVVVHKMGVTAAEDLKDKYFFDMVSTPQIMNGHRYGQLFDAAFETPVMDYRHAVITRNWYDAITSGYLYHKSGRECWLDWFGNPGHEGWLLNNRLENWERRLLQDPTIMARNLQWTPGNGRDLCRYLADEPVEMGLRVYSAWAIASFMNPLLDFRRRRLEMEAKMGRNRTTFVCFEQVTSPSGHAEAVNTLFQWFFPKDRIRKLRIRAEKYEGGHATDKDPSMRNRMYETVSKIDAKYFRGSIAQGSAVFGCGEASNVAITR